MGPEHGACRLLVRVAELLMSMSGCAGSQPLPADLSPAQYLAGVGAALFLGRAGAAAQAVGERQAGGP
ncbi:hypothetical protein GCM10022255_000650 [Dactylosporangium darangshiense]|uniref:Uncharacterized protein n=1 Tax=Dactylosporangium darangshiense TaxID=579108 RepID=A0ABP8CTF9_9ACTN